MERRMVEAELEALFRKRVRLALGGDVIKLAPTHAGMPDRLVMLPYGRFHLVELKTETGKLSPIQTVWHARALKLGSKVEVLYGKEEIIQWVTDRANEFAPPSFSKDTIQPRSKKR